MRMRSKSLTAVLILLATTPASAQSFYARATLQRSDATPAPPSSAAQWVVSWRQISSCNVYASDKQWKSGWRYAARCMKDGSDVAANQCTDPKPGEFKDETRLCQRKTCSNPTIELVDVKDADVTDGNIASGSSGLKSACESRGLDICTSVQSTGYSSGYAGTRIREVQGTVSRYVVRCS